MMFSRRQILTSGGSFAIIGLRNSATGNSRRTDMKQSGVPPGGVPSIGQDAVVQFDYPDGTRIRVYETEIEIIKPNQRPERRPRFPIDVQVVTPPAVPNDATLKAWLEALAGDLRDTIKVLLINDNRSIGNYDSFEKTQSLTIYKKIALRFKYIKRLTRVE